MESDRYGFNWPFLVFWLGYTGLVLIVTSALL